eukprot:14331432-Alexandrium_andersonii.AAC.1
MSSMRAFCPSALSLRARLSFGGCCPQRPLRKDAYSDALRGSLEALAGPVRLPEASDDAHFSGVCHGWPLSASV